MDKKILNAFISEKKGKDEDLQTKKKLQNYVSYLKAADANLKAADEVAKELKLSAEEKKSIMKLV
jgi:hypothetical protein